METSGLLIKEINDEGLGIYKPTKQGPTWRGRLSDWPSVVHVRGGAR